VSDARTVEHALRNHIAIILGYAELLVQECAPGDPRREDLDEIYKAATAAMKLLHSKDSAA